MSQTRMMYKRSFTLLELLIGIALIVVISGAVGLRVGMGIEEKKFQSSIGRLFVELEACRHLALNSQADWIAILEEKDGCFILHKSCPEMQREVTASWKSPCQIHFNQEKANLLSFQFSSSGKLSPQGILSFSDGKRKISWTLPDHFSVFEISSVR